MSHEHGIDRKQFFTVSGLGSFAAHLLGKGHRLEATVDEAPEPEPEMLPPVKTYYMTCCSTAAFIGEDG